MRHPVDRVVSQFFYQRESLDPTNPVNCLVYTGQLTLSEYAQRTRNVQSRMISGLPSDDFAFLGVTERFDESLAMFRHRYHLPHMKSGRRRNKRKLSPEGVDEDLREEIGRLNSDDMSLYALACERLEAWCREPGSFDMTPDKEESVPK